MSEPDSDLVGIITGTGDERQTFACESVVRRQTFACESVVRSLAPTNLYALYVVPSEQVAVALRSILSEFRQTTPVVVDKWMQREEFLAVPKGHPLCQLYSADLCAQADAIDARSKP